MARNPHRSFCILTTSDFNLLSSWQGAVYVRKSNDGPWPRPGRDLPSVPLVTRPPFHSSPLLSTRANRHIA
jgi:hypothetical protein